MLLINKIKVKDIKTTLVAGDLKNRTFICLLILLSKRAKFYNKCICKIYDKCNKRDYNCEPNRKKTFKHLLRKKTQEVRFILCLEQL